MKISRFSAAPCFTMCALLACLCTNAGAARRKTTSSGAQVQHKKAPHFSRAVLETQTTPKAASNATARAASTRGASWLPATLVIPKLRVDAPIVRGVDNAALRLGVGFDPDSDAAGENGNCVIAGHRNVWGAWFWHLPKLTKGDLVFINTAGKRLTYRVEFARVVQPHETEVLEAPPGQAAPRLTLYTCTKPKTDCRFIVVANLVTMPDKKIAPVAKISQATMKAPASTRRKIVAPKAAPSPRDEDTTETRDDGVIILQ